MADFDPSQMLLDVSELHHGMCYSFQTTDAEPGEGFLINWHGRIYAYRNACPHTGVTLNWAPNQFMDIDERLIQCGLHGALFEPASGLCIHGPCLGQSLQRIPIAVHAGQIYLVT